MICQVAFVYSTAKKENYCPLYIYNKTTSDKFYYFDECRFFYVFSPFFESVALETRELGYSHDFTARRRCHKKTA